MHDAERPHHLRSEVTLFATECGAAGEGDPLGAIHDVPRGVLRHERVVAGRLQVLRELVEHEVPGLLFPLRAARRSVEGLLDPARARRELHRGRTLRAEASLVDRAVGIALDLQQLRLAVRVLLRVGDETATDGAVRAERLHFLRAGETELLLDLLRAPDVEAER